MSPRFPNPGVALAAVVVSLFRVLLRCLLFVRHRLIGGLRLAAGLRAVRLLGAGSGQTAAAETVQRRGDRVSAGEGVLEVAHVLLCV